MADGAVVVKGLVPWGEMCESFDEAVALVVELLRDLPPQAAPRPVPGLEWTVGQTAAHLIGILGRGLGDTRRGKTLQGMHELNEVCIEEVDTRDLRVIADRIEADARRGAPFRAAARGDEPFPLHAGVVAEVSAAISYGLWDFLVHGFDIASGCGRSWPMPAVGASRALRAGLPALRPWVRPEVLDGPAQELAVGFEPDGQGLALHVGHGRYDVAARGAAAEVVDPVEAVLAISRRVPASHPALARLAGWYLPI